MLDPLTLQNEALPIITHDNVCHWFSFQRWNVWTRTITVEHGAATCVKTSTFQICLTSFIAKRLAKLVNVSFCSDFMLKKFFLVQCFKWKGVTGYLRVRRGAFRHVLWSMILGSSSLLTGLQPHNNKMIRSERTKFSRIGRSLLFAFFS